MKQINRMTEKETQIYVAQILSCLESIHGKNIKHRDIKPENIMLDDHNNIKIVYFFSPSNQNSYRLILGMPIIS